MKPDFQPLFRNPHIATLAGNFWPRRIDLSKYPSVRCEYRIHSNVTVVAYEHKPLSEAVGQVTFVHGLEGSADAGYIASCAQEALRRGFGVHRLNLRTCGGTEHLCETMYHSGLTGDTRRVLEVLQEQVNSPLFLVGFSLGGNVALKLAGELGQSDLLSGVVAVSAPIDLAESVRSIDKPVNFLYVNRFLRRLRQRVRTKSRTSPDLYSEAGLSEVRSIWDFDDRFTAPLFGFGTAANYYATQSAKQYLSGIRIPTLIITAQDDPLVPFHIYRDPVIAANPALALVATEHGGHLGFLARGKRRFWLDHFTMDWIQRQTTGVTTLKGTKPVQLASVKAN